MAGGETGKVVVITGATGAHGAAVARALSEAGFLLVLNSPSMEKLTSLAAELGGPCTVVAGSLTDETLPETLLYAALDRFGRCDICINNGALYEAGIIETVDIERLITMVKVNVEGTVRIAYVFLKHFVSEGSGHLVNVSHGVGNSARPTPFAATQSAIEILSDALAMELDGTDVHVTSIKPGLAKTGLHARWEIAPEGHVGPAEPLEPEDFARMVLFILEQASPTVHAAPGGEDAVHEPVAEILSPQPAEEPEPAEQTRDAVPNEAAEDQEV
jgi:NADP-dependent 3-hydroxy acid dehydrogenase YdfG